VIALAFSLNEKEKRAISTLVQERMDEHLSRFPFARYPIEPFEAWKHIFAEPQSVPAETLRDAFRWPLGGWARKNLPSTHHRTTIKMIKIWPEFAENAAFEPSQIFQFWEQRLPDWNTGFNTTTFLLHLMRSDEIEITDAHRISAMHELIQAVGISTVDPSHPLSFVAVEQYSQFFRLILQKLTYGTESRIKLDRFLKAYGNRHAYKNVAAEYKTSEPTIRQFSCLFPQTSLSHSFPYIIIA